MSHADLLSTLDPHLIERFNEGCHCITLDRDALFRALSDELAAAGHTTQHVDRLQNLFAPVPMFVSRAHMNQMSQLVKAVEAAARTPAWERAVAAWAPEIARPGGAHKGVFFGYDVHLGPEGPQLIEINTNAGGALFNAYLARAQRACCAPVTQALVNTVDPAQIEASFMRMFLHEWQLQRGSVPLRTVAIVDTQPETQGLFPEFVLFQQFFMRNGIKAFIADPSELQWEDGALKLRGETIDLVYNRLCDFYLEQPEHWVLAQAYQSGAAVITPFPNAYARFGDKRNLTLLSDEGWLREAGLDEATIDVLRAGVPKTVLVTPDLEDELWQKRKDLFFKPVTGYGSRAVYRGAKLTKKVWAHIVSSGYVAQVEVEPSQRVVKAAEPDAVLKADLRAYVYDGEIQLLAARLYRGQTTNMSTPAGGFAAVFTENF